MEAGVDGGTRSDAGAGAGRHREQADPTEPQQGQRVEVLRAASGTPVQAALGRYGRQGAARVPGQQHAHRGTGRHHVTGAHPGTYRLVGGP
ncbi:hypothetical protein TPA0907_39900 [Micromonospora humidisoli]|nr:hypothetical protein TPA0907_39900 [Micromonospora sp. AKA109]